MRRVPFWIRWSWRDLRKRWLLVAAIALTIGIGTGAYGGLTSTFKNRPANNVSRLTSSKKLFNAFTAEFSGVTANCSTIALFVIFKLSDIFSGTEVVNVRYWILDVDVGCEMLDEGYFV